MAKKKSAKKTVTRTRSDSSPKYPYTISTSELRKLLQLIPEKPKPTVLNTSTAKTWGILGGNVTYSITVLREIGLIDNSGGPTAAYIAYMTKGSGGAALGHQIKERYKSLFEHHQNPQNASTEDLLNFFNIHSGGADTTIQSQIRTFKVLCEFATFDTGFKPALKGAPVMSTSAGENSIGASIHFDFHLHLPEGKTSADYEAILKSVSEHIIAKIRG